MLTDLAEAATHTDRQHEARRLLADFDALSARMDSPVLSVNVVCAKALLAHDEQADRAYLDALAAELADWPFFRARNQLAYGRWLRRQRRVRESRLHLRASRDALEALGARPWAEIAATELRATGETVRKQGPSTRDTLTPQELQIATLAAEGLSNRDIGQRLFLSHRTVSSHLYHIFPKLGIASRAELGPALGRLPARDSAIPVI